MSAHHRWEFDLSVDEGKRLPILTAGMNFSSIAKQIRDEMSILCVHCSEMGKRTCSNEEDKTAFRRPVYTIAIEPWLFDVFFNSSTGYRAAYFLGAGTGLDMNAFFMRAVACRLLDESQAFNTSLTKDFIRESLLSPSAKVWLAEAGKEIDRKCGGCKGEWNAVAGGETTTEILNGRWEKKVGYKAVWGRKAPYLRKLRIMGAFLNARHDELIPFDKRSRASEIHKCGWS